MAANADDVIDQAICQLGEAKTLEDVQEIVRCAARRAVNAHGATMVLLEGDQCYYLDEDSMSPLWKGMRFPAANCISGWAMLNGETVVIPDIRVDSRIPQKAYRPTFVRSLVMTPIRRESPIGAIGAYWALCHCATDVEVGALEALGAAAGEVMVHRGLPSTAPPYAPLVNACVRPTPAASGSRAASAGTGAPADGRCGVGRGW
ncbi:hypothetical protein GCM10010174_39940 [Kutzneria viridogrisea]|uniref:GAF domain-containing protein n=2 Tax=Kutzneria TaxID=43356 RepID=W5W621_9PSEU|nr:GAF domain-containing protein [Kutzneria albida]AHH96643.1 hypothetical protein KALB_3276 [Kutzneria albida DSM 43870]MBA8928136.1 GAF domain-containing protein [Kutzneria viridogrisea]